MPRPPKPAPRSPDPPKPRFSPSELPTRPNRNENAARWAVIAEMLPALDGQAQAILRVVAAALADMPPTEPEQLIGRFDAMGHRQRIAFAAVVHALAAPSELG
jgi:hypothetical protein